MGIQTMASQGGGGGGQHSQFQSLSKQGSLYSLTLNEVQNQLGEPLHSMNLDELLRNVLPLEGEQSLGMDLANAPPEFASGSGLQRQGSVTLARTLSKKTVDEVWRDIQQGQNKGNNERKAAQERQPTLGEMTLEDFLAKAGVVTEGSEKKRKYMTRNEGPVGSPDWIARPQGYPQGVHWLQQYHHQMPSLQPQQQAQQNMMSAYMPGRPLPQALGVGVGNILDACYPDTQMTMSSPVMATSSDSHTPSQKRVVPGDIVEKTVERRQKRMIKNRESAARSRARKQAYTNELENKVSRLEEENERLKKQKELEKILYSVPPPEPKYQLRRTSSASF